METSVSVKLKKVLDDAQWTQEQLARQLDVPFKTINQWVNEKAEPRSKNLEAINELYLDIVGRTGIDTAFLTAKKEQALSMKMTVKEILSNEQLLDKITLYLTYHTNTIEGSTMALSDVKEVLEDDNKVLTNKTAKEQIEARNHRTALFYLMDELNSQDKDFKWSKDIVLNAHLRLMNTLISNAGHYRNHEVQIGGSNAKLAPFSKIDSYMDELIADLNKPTGDFVGDIAQLHARFERIHPFSDGNGRIGRLIMFIQALQFRLMPPLILKERKRAYYRYLEVADFDGKYDLITLFIAESILTTSDLISDK